MNLSQRFRTWGTRNGYRTHSIPLVFLVELFPQKKVVTIGVPFSTVPLYIFIDIRSFIETKKSVQRSQQSDRLIRDAALE